ncbi:MAG: hypothetical protein ABS903_17425 [Solibacillus sp.]
MTLTGEAQLNAGDIIDLYYQSGGLSLTLNLGGISASSTGIVWSCHRIS